MEKKNRGGGVDIHSKVLISLVQYDMTTDSLPIEMSAVMSLAERQKRG